MPFDLKSLVAARMGENYELHSQHLNPTLVQVQRTIGFDRVYVRAKGAYLYDAEGHAYLDFLSGYSVFNVGRNHPVVAQALRDALDLDLPNMVQMDCSLMSGLLGEALLKKTPAHLDAVFFCNSGTEAVEGAMKFARAATGRPRVVSLKGSYHGLSYGALSITGSDSFQEGFGPFLADTELVALGDLTSLEATLAMGDVAAFIVEPIQGKGVNYPLDDYFQKAQALCRKHGTLLICDEVQTGLGRTGKWWAFQHWDLEPDIVTMAKTLSGGYVPCGAIVTRRSIYQRVFSRLDRCVVHSSTFGRNNLAMTCALATLTVLEDEKLVENSAAMGELLMQTPAHAQDQASLHQGNPRQGTDDRHRVPRTAAAQGQAGVAAHAQDRPVAFPAARRRADAQQAPRAHAGRRAPHGCHQNPAALTIGEAEVDHFVNALDETLTECTSLSRADHGTGHQHRQGAVRRRAGGPAPARRQERNGRATATRTATATAQERPRQWC